MKIRKSISLDDKLWIKIDKLKGDISRSKYIGIVLNKFIVNLKGGKK
jgi:hypothetical protein